MSTIGGLTAAGMNLAGSIVGSSHPEAVADQGDAASADHRAQIDRDATLAQPPEDVADAEFSSDRDADGRQMYLRRPLEPLDSTETAADGSDVVPIPRGRSHAADASGDRGNALDIDA
ncbi:MAG TPA: hypothetical protein VFG04_30035 [Planctomycetaceae bacterium]|jgi:hypothetical protein|nr:hypothetical protein [Planctomycetaceae bacterium]